MLTPDDKKRIRTLLAQIDAIYSEATHRPSGRVCDICGEGDFQAKHALLKVKDVAQGYEHRPSQSPKLCFRHYSGWSHSLNCYSAGTGRADEEVDLHFALYLAKQLQKEKANENIRIDRNCP
jgi:hypothetical protein